MIRLRIKELCDECGIRYARKALIQAGISGPTATKYLKGKRKTIVNNHVECLCTLLRCVPNDLWEWTPTSKNHDYPENPLQAIRKKPPLNVQALLKTMTLEQIRKTFGKDAG